MAKYDTQIFRVDGKNCFMEVLNSAFCFKVSTASGDAIVRKLQISMVRYNETTKKQELKLDFYLDFKDALALSHQILYGILDRKIREAKQTGLFEGNKINDYTSYWSNMGGTKEAKKRDAEEFNWVEVGKPISKQLKIQNSTKYKYILRGEYGKGTIGDTGLIMPNGKAEAYIMIPLSESDAIGLAKTIEVHIQAYWNQFYSNYSKVLFPMQDCTVFEAKPSNQQEQSVQRSSAATANKPSNNVNQSSSNLNNNTTANTTVPSNEAIPFYEEKVTPANDNTGTLNNATQTNFSMISFRATTLLTPTKKNNGDMCVKVLEKDNEKYVFFRKNVIDTTPRYNEFKALLESKINGERRPYYEFTAYVTKIADNMYDFVRFKG